MATANVPAPQSDNQSETSEGLTLELRKYLLLMAILAATVTYVAGLNPPGGVWLSTTDGHLTGNEILVVADHARYNAFFYSNATAFMASVVVIFLLLVMVRGMDEGPDTAPKKPDARVLVALRVVMVLDLLALMVAYAAGASRGTATTVSAGVLVSAVSIYATFHISKYVYRSMCLPPDSHQTNHDLEKKNLKYQQLRKIMMLFAVFAATVTYTAGLNPPGGFWPDSLDGHRAGDPVLQEHHWRRFIAFFIFNTAAFAASLVAVMLLATIRGRNTGWWHVPYSFVLVALCSLFVAYAIGSCRKTHSTVYLFCTVAAVAACTAFLFFIQKYLPKTPAGPGEDEEGVSPANEASGDQTPCWSNWICCGKSSRCSCWSNWICRAKSSSAGQPADANAGERWRKEALSLVLLLGTLAATITYQAGLSPPGGFWPDDRDGHKGGDPILLTTHFRRYKVFFYCNSVALVASVVVIGMVLSKHLRERVHRYHALESAMILDLLSLVASYAVGSCRDVSTSLHVVAIAGGVLVYVVIHIVVFTLEKHQDGWKSKQMKRNRKLLLLFAILVATITYQAGLTPPGGFWADDQSGHAAGFAVLASNYPRRYTAFFYSNAASFMASVAIIILLVNPNLYVLGIKCRALYICAVGGLFGLMGAYAAGSSRHMKTSIYVIVLLAVVSAFIILVVLLVKMMCHPRAPKPDAPQQDSEGPPLKRLYTMRKYLMLVGILVASVTYQAGLTPPGGVWPDSVDGHAAGDPVLRDSNKRRYRFFFYSNSVSFLASAMVILLLLLDEPLFAHKDDDAEPRTKKGLLAGYMPSLPPILRSYFRKHGLTTRELLRVAQFSIMLALFCLLFAYASGCSREWETSGYVIALAVAVGIYIAIHVLLSCFDNSSGNTSAPGATSDKKCACSCHDKATDEEGNGIP